MEKTNTNCEPVGDKDIFYKIGIFGRSKVLKKFLAEHTYKYKKYL